MREISALSEVVERFRGALEAFPSEGGTSKAALEVLLARDAVHETWAEIETPAQDGVGELHDLGSLLEELDEALLLKGGALADALDLELWRQRRASELLAETHWWWFLEPSPSAWDRLDWLWSGLAAGALALVASYTVNIYRAIALGNVSIAETFSAIVQGAGLAVLSGGVLSSAGQEKVEALLLRLKVPPRFQREVLLIASLVLLGVVYRVNHRLDEHYFEKGAAFYKEGRLEHAAQAYRQGLQLDPELLERRNELGEIYESLGALEKAAEEYRRGAEEGDPKSLNALGRVTLHKDPILAESYLMFGLQRLQGSQADDHHLRYQLNRNLGWALLNQKRYPMAKIFLLAAVKLDTGEDTERKGEGMAECFLAQIHEDEQEVALAQHHWRACLRRARPEFIHEFQWFIEVGKDFIAWCSNSSQVLARHTDRSSLILADSCKELYEAKDLDLAIEQAIERLGSDGGKALVSGGPSPGDS